LCLFVTTSLAFFIIKFPSVCGLICIDPHTIRVLKEERRERMNMFADGVHLSNDLEELTPVNKCQYIDVK
jgi:hypothetical protein